MVTQHLQAGQQHLARGQFAEAAGVLRRVLEAEPDHPVANQLLGMALAQLKDYAGAAEHLGRAAAVSRDPGLMLNLGMMRLAAGDIEGAEEALRRGLAIKPDMVEGQACLGSLLATRQRAGEAEACFAAALRLAPDRADVIYPYTRMLTETGRAEEAVAVLRSALARKPGDLLLQDKLCMMLNYVGGVPPREVFAEHVKFGELAEGAIAPMPLVERDWSVGRRLRVGYLSADLREHSVAYFLEPLLEHHDREGFEVFVYQVAPGDEVVTNRLRGRLRGKVDAWREVVMAPDEAVAEAIAGDRIDVLVELGGHTAGNRLLVMARRPAPVQMTYLGYPNTTGLTRVGWRIVDAVTDPDVPGAEALATERLARVSPCFLCYRAPEVLPEVKAGPRERGEAVTFGSFNSLAKLSPRAIGLWARVLQSVPGSRLVLKGKALGDASVSRLFVERFAKAGVEASRLELLSHAATTAEHLGAYAKVDIALDPFPYCGTTTTCEALLMGVPVVSLRGEVHAGRVGSSLLGALGLEEFVAESEEAYERIAVELAGDAARLSALRRELRGRLLGSVLCAGAVFVPKVEEVYRRAWGEWCGGKV